MLMIWIGYLFVYVMEMSTVCAMPMTECRDISTRCQQYLHYCGVRAFVTDRCQKSCGICATPTQPVTATSTRTSTTTTSTARTTQRPITPSPTTTDARATSITARTVSALEDECMTIHWHFRMLHQNSRKLQWDNQLQGEAQQWADHLASTGGFEQSTNRRNVGENIFQYDSLDQKFEGKCLLAVYFWYAEAFFYNFKTHTSSGKTSNYTQMIWKDTRRVGFGLARNGNRFIVVAHYFPAGNIEGQFKENVMPPKFTGVILE